MEKLHFPLLLLLPFCLLTQDLVAETQLSLGDNVVELVTEPESTANKARLLRLQDGTLIVAWQQGYGAPDGAWDLDGTLFAARDIFIRTSVDNGESWSAPVNVSGTAELSDVAAFYDRIGDGTGLANFYGDSGKGTVIASGNNLLVIWNDTYCGDGLHGPALYEGPAGMIQLPYRCLYAARVLVTSGTIDIMGRDRITSATRGVTNEVARISGGGFAMAWQEDPQGLQLGEALGEGDGSSGARVSSGTDIWYSWMPKGEFSNNSNPWRSPLPISDNYDYETLTAISGGASRPMLAMAGNPTTAVLVYEEAKESGSTDIGKYVRYHQFPFDTPPQSAAGTIVSDPAQNSRRARLVMMSSPGTAFGTRMLLMWRQGEGIQGAPADFMMRVGAVPAGTDSNDVTNAGFRVSDLSPSVDVANPANNVPGLNISAADLFDATSKDPLSNAKAHRAVMDGDFIYAAYTQDANATDGLDQYQFWTRWSDDGGANWAPPAQVSAGVPDSENVIEPRLIRTPGTVQTGKPEDIRNKNIFVLAWGTEYIAADSAKPVRDSLFVTRTVDRGQSFERVQTIEPTKTGPEQTDEQIQLRVTPDGEQVAAVWIRREPTRSTVVFDTARGITRTADLSVNLSSETQRVDKGDRFQISYGITNKGPQVATDVEISLQVPNNAILNQNQACKLLDDQLTCILPSLAVNESWQNSADFFAATAGHATLSVTASAIEMDDDSNNNSVNLSITILDDPVGTPGGSGGGCVYAPSNNTDSTLPMLLIFGLLWRLRKWQCEQSLETSRI